MSDNTDMPLPPLPSQVEEPAEGELEIELPAGIRRAIVVYEMQDGTFGFKPLDGTVKLTIDDVAELASRVLRRVQVDMIAGRVLAVTQPQKQLGAGAPGLYLPNVRRA